MNPDQTMAIRVAIRDTCDQLRPPVMGPGLPEHTRTALQAHLDALLKEELRALTGQAPEGDLAGFAEQNEKFAQDMGLRQASADAFVASTMPTPWYPDDSGDWVEVRNDCMTCPVAEAMLIEYLLLGERTRQSHIPTPQYAGDLDWVFAASHPARIVAYKVVKP